MKLAEFREAYPQYDDMSDQELADRLHNKYYSDINKSDFYSRIGFQPAAPVTPPQTGPRVLADSDTSSDFVRGITNYLPQLKQTLGGAGVLAGRVLQNLGAEETGRGMIQSGIERMKAAETQTTVREADDVTKAWEKGIGSVVFDWLPYMMGQGVANIGEAAVTALAGALAGSAAAPGPGTAGGALTGFVAKGLAKKGIQEAAEKIVKESGEAAGEAFIQAETKKILAEGADAALRSGYIKEGSKHYGQIAALASTAGVRGAGEVTGRAAEEAERRGENVEDISVARVLPTAVIHAAAEFLGDRIMMKAIKPTGSTPEEIAAAKKFAEAAPQAKFSITNGIVAEIVKNIAKTGTKEVPVELVQTVAERFGAQLDLADAEALREYINAAAGSYAMVAPAATVGGARSKFERDAQVAQAIAAQQAQQQAAQTPATPETPAEPEVQIPISTPAPPLNLEPMPPAAETPATETPATETPAASVVEEEESLEAIKARLKPKKPTAPIPEAAPATTPTYTTLQTLQPGTTVTLYRGENAQNDQDGQWWTSDPNKAAKYGNVVSIDLPAEVIGKNAAQGHNGPDEFVFPNKKPSELAKAATTPTAPKAEIKATAPTVTPTAPTAPTTSESVSLEDLLTLPSRSKVVKDDKYAALKQRISENGITEPVVVTQDSAGNLEVFEGGDTLVAAQELGIKDVPVVLRERSAAENIPAAPAAPIKLTEAVGQSRASRANVIADKAVDEATPKAEEEAMKAARVAAEEKVSKAKAEAEAQNKVLTDKSAQAIYSSAYGKVFNNVLRQNLQAVRKEAYDKAYADLAKTPAKKVVLTKEQEESRQEEQKKQLEAKAAKDAAIAEESRKKRIAKHEELTKQGQAKKAKREAEKESPVKLQEKSKLETITKSLVDMTKSRKVNLLQVNSVAKYFGITLPKEVIPFQKLLIVSNVANSALAWNKYTADNIPYTMLSVDAREMWESGKPSTKLADEVSSKVYNDIASLIYYYAPADLSALRQTKPEKLTVDRARISESDPYTKVDLDNAKALLGSITIDGRTQVKEKLETIIDYEQKQADIEAKAKEVEEARAAAVKANQEKIAADIANAPAKQEKADIALVSKVDKDLRERNEKERARAEAEGNIAAKEAAAFNPKAILKDIKEAEEAGYDEDSIGELSREGGEIPLTENAVNELKDNNLSAALSDIAENSKTAFDRLLAQRLIPLLRNTQTVIRDGLTDNDGNPVAGGASPNGRYIYLDSKEGLNEETVLHEGVHAGTELILNADPKTLTQDQRTAIAELKALHNRAKQLGLVKPGTPAYNNVKEFMVEGLTNPALRKGLSTFRWKFTNAWEGFKRVLLNMLGIDTPKSMFDALVAVTDTIFSPPQATGAMGKPSVFQQKTKKAPGAGTSVTLDGTGEGADLYKLQPGEKPRSSNWVKKYFWSRPGFRYLATKVQNSRYAVHAWENAMRLAGLIVTERGKINNIYTQIVLASGRSRDLYNRDLKRHIDALDVAIANLAKATGKNTDDTLTFMHILSESLHEPERRMIKYLMMVPLTTEQTLQINGTRISPADRRNDIIKLLEGTPNLTKQQALALRNELDGIVFKNTAKDPKTGLILDTSESNLTKNVDSRGYTVASLDSEGNPRKNKKGEVAEFSTDINSEAYVVTSNSPEAMAKNREDYEKHPQKEKIDDVLKIMGDIRDATKELNKLGNHWTPPVNNYANFYDWKHYVPMKGLEKGKAPKNSYQEIIEEKLDYERIRGKEHQDIDFKMYGRASVSNNPVLQLVADSVRSAMRAGSVDVSLAIKNSLKNDPEKNPNGTGLIKGYVKAHIPFTDRNNEELQKAKAEKTLLHHNPDGSIDVLVIDDDVMLHAIRRTYDDTNPLVDIANNITSGLGQLHTRYNYQFAPLNFVRDALTNAFTIGADMGPAKAAAFLREVSTRVVAGNGLYKAMRVATLYGTGKAEDRAQLNQLAAKDSYIRDMLDYIETGGMVSYIQGISLKSNFQRLHKEIGRSGIMKKKEQLEQFLDIWNDMFEIASRSAAFAVVRQNTLTKRGLTEATATPEQMLEVNQEAAAYVKNLANFEQVGDLGRGLGALYMFIRPAATGAVRAIEAIAPAFTFNIDALVDSLPESIKGNAAARETFIKNFKERQKNARIMATGLTALGAVAYLMALMTSDDDELGRNAVATDNMQQWTRFARFHIPRSITRAMGIQEPVILQMPWGFGLGAFAASGAQMMSVVAGSGQSLGDAMANIFTQISLDSFIPIPVSRMPVKEMPLEFVLDSVAPSAVRPLLEFALNKNGLGQDIYNDRNRRMGDAYTAGDKIPEMYKDASAYFAEKSNGKFDISPNSLYFLANSYMDGPFRIAEGLTGIYALGSGAKGFNPKTDLPLMGSFFGARSNVDSREFTAIERKIQEKERILKMFDTQQMKPEIAARYRAENPLDETIVQMYNSQVGGELNQLRQRANEVRRMSELSQGDRKAWLDTLTLQQNIIKRRMIETFKAYGVEP